VICAGLALANALDLGRVQRVELWPTLAMPLPLLAEGERLRVPSEGH